LRMIAKVGQNLKEINRTKIYTVEWDQNLEAIIPVVGQGQ
jgi:hypothetical protein